MIGGGRGCEPQAPAVGSRRRREEADGREAEAEDGREAERVGYIAIRV